ncbi:MAG: hypothetical protein ACLUEK_11655 [Oscillospiraceae bacterium]
MNLAGVAVNNSNWPRIVRAARIWTCAAVVLCPALELLLSGLAPAFWQRSERYIFAAAAPACSRRCTPGREARAAELTAKKRRHSCGGVFCFAITRW